MITLKCQSCGVEEDFASYLIAYENGWDTPQTGSPVTTCGKCPSAPLLFHGIKQTTPSQQNTGDDMGQDRVVVTWPESQELMDHARFDECTLLNDEQDLIRYGSSAYLCPRDLYEEIYVSQKELGEYE